MGIWFRQTERRLNGFSITSWASTAPVSPAAGARNSLAALTASSEVSLQTVAMWSAVDLICSLVSELPIDVLRGSGASRKVLAVPSYLQDPGGEGYGVEDWISQLLMSWVLRGNINGRVLGWSRDSDSAWPTQIQLLHPDSVAGWYDEGGRPVWRVAGGDIPPGQMWHRRVHTVPGRLMGLSPVQQQAATLGLTLSATRFGLDWFAEGAHPSAVMQSKSRNLGPDGATTAKQRFMAAIRGREPVVIDGDWQYTPIQINPEESQFLETNKFSQAQVARIFGPGMAEILGYESGGSLTYSTVEGRSQHLLVYALNKWMRRVERVLSSMLPRGQSARLNRSALLEPTVLDRWRVYQIQLATGARAINEVRDDEDWTPVPWGDQPAVSIPAQQPADPDPNEPMGDPSAK
ncbi:phage portal protein [Salinispora cortesiana]|uniref:phage portal protein n=1 Tax=Salinispora cortesiana TaxID=1305843 RepID=UPI0004017954|nr:phage portal protein [Salinispora cortesiana]